MYQGFMAEYDIKTLDILAGKLPSGAHALVLEWASLPLGLAYAGINEKQKAGDAVAHLVERSNSLNDVLMNPNIEQSMIRYVIYLNFRRFLRTRSTRLIWKRTNAMDSIRRSPAKSTPL